ncbi:MAG: phage tail sheath subtilisin-like domain-containing protein [Pseudomonadota bacterium]|nr:phage tail sheath subtilisin-like domain-containing protein [Pseudomonadota bacterium]
MASIARIPLGAPGLYPYPDIPIRALTRVRLDVCAFVGVAPRGPARVPADGSADIPSRRTVAVAVESFDEYRQVYGGFEGPGLLPYAVASFFEQGGRRAYVARIVHEYALDPVPSPAANDLGVASGDVPGASSTAGPLRLRARNEGAWGNLLRAGLSFTTRPLAFDPGRVSLTGLELPPGIDVTAGALLRVNYGGGLRELRFVAYALESRLPQKAGSVWTVTFDRAAGALPRTIEIVEAALVIDDGAGRSERHERLGLSPQHARWMATILATESALVYPDNSWVDSALTPDDLSLASDPAVSAIFTGGEDRYPDITPEDFFDPLWTIGDEEPGNGIHALSQLSDLSLLVAPDLYSPFPLVEPRKLQLPVSLAGSTFTRCVDLPAPPVAPEPPPADLVNLRLDPAIPEDLERITTFQTRVVDFADQVRSFVVLLDVPPGLTQRRILSWRSRFQSSYAAAYHPWLVVVRQDDQRNTRVPLPPSAATAGIIAQVENTFGVPHGPANVIAAQVLDVRETVSPARHDELHPLGINVYLLERDGVRLTAARTLSSDPAFRQLSVRRLLVLIRRTLEQQMQWVAFEPNNSALRAELRQLLRVYLRQLFTAGAFRGATEDESFFVRCDDTNNPQRIADLGQLLVEVGVAPSEPLEFIVLRLSRDADGSLTATEARG